MKRSRWMSRRLDGTLHIFSYRRFNKKICLLSIYTCIYIEYQYSINMINYSVSFPRHPWIFSWMSDTQDCKIPSTWTCITQTLVPFIPPYPSVCIISNRFHISSDMTCLQSKAFAETQCHQLVTSFALRKVACTNWICNTSVVQHKMPGRNLHMKRITQPLFLPIIRGSLLGIAWLVNTFHQKNSRNLLVNFQNSLLCSYHLHINPSQDPPNLPRPKTKRTTKNIHPFEDVYRCMSYWKMAMFLHIANPPGVSINSPGNLLGEFHQGSTPPWVPSSIHSLDQRLPPLTTTKIWDQPEKPIELTLQVC